MPTSITVSTIGHMIPLAWAAEDAPAPTHPVRRDRNPYSLGLYADGCALAPSCLDCPPRTARSCRGPGGGNPIFSALDGASLVRL